MIICLDTSAINRLHDDSERDVLITGLLAAGSFRITAINVVELARTPDSGQRVSLLQLAARLSDGKRPLAHPNTLLRDGIAAFARRDKSVNVSVNEDEEGVWIALQQPEDVVDSVVEELNAWHAGVEGALTESAKHRQEYVEMFRAAQSSGPRSAAEAIRGTLSGKAIFEDSLSDIFERASGRAPSPNELDQVWSTVPQWRLYLMALTYGIYARNMRPNHFSPRRNAGLIDLTSACYLALCDMFVTADLRQYHALRLLARFGKAPPCQVRLYDRLRERLMLN